MDKYIVTGNDSLSLPRINEQTAGIENISFMFMQFKGAINLQGNSEQPFLRPVVTVADSDVCVDPVWSKQAYWIPTFSAGDCVEGCILTPVEDRGFIYKISYCNKTDNRQTVSIGFDGCWEETQQAINGCFPITLEKRQDYSWYGIPVFGLVQTVPIFYYSFVFNSKMQSQLECDGNVCKYSFTKQVTLNPGESETVELFFGLGCDAVSAATSAIEMQRKTFEGCLSESVRFLDSRSFGVEDKELEGLLNYNLFFSYFFAAGKTIDSDELVLCTSRSSRYYVSVAYWDRDSLLWNFPAILQVDSRRALAMLEYVFTKQIKNVGIHSRFIDGTVLEPGFELDELCAPVIALYNYVDKTGDKLILREPIFEKGVKRILDILGTKKHATVDLYETMLYPSDDMHTYKYLTYDNVLVEKMLHSLAELYNGIWDDETVGRLKLQGDRVAQAIEENCISEINGKNMYVWSTDLEGSHKIYDEPPGSLVLLKFYGHRTNEEAYTNTVERLYSEDYPYSFSNKKFSEIGCSHCNHPWVLSYCNSLLCGRVEQTVKAYKQMKMDNGIVCETINEDTGEASSGNAFATCAGFFAYTLMTALKKD